MRVLIQPLLILLIISVAALTVAGDPQPQKNIDPPARTDAQTPPDLDINQAEIQAGVVPDLSDGLKSQSDAAAVSPMIAEIRATLEASRLAVADLAAQAPLNRDHAADVALQKQVSQLKQQAELDILAIQLRYARADGKEELALKIEAGIEAIISPPAPERPAEARPAPNHQR